MHTHTHTHYLHSKFWALDKNLSFPVSAADGKKKKGFSWWWGWYCPRCEATCKPGNLVPGDTEGNWQLGQSKGPALPPWAGHSYQTGLYSVLGVSFQKGREEEAAAQRGGSVMLTRWDVRWSWSHEAHFSWGQEIAGVESRDRMAELKHLKRVRGVKMEWITLRGDECPATGGMQVKSGGTT